MIVLSVKNHANFFFLRLKSSILHIKQSYWSFSLRKLNQMFIFKRKRYIFVYRVCHFIRLNRRAFYFRICSQMIWIRNFSDSNIFFSLHGNPADGALAPRVVEIVSTCRLLSMTTTCIHQQNKEAEYKFCY